MAGLVLNPMSKLDRVLCKCSYLAESGLGRGLFPNFYLIRYH